MSMPKESMADQDQDPVEALKDELALFVTDLLRRENDPVTQEFRAAVARSIGDAVQRQLADALGPIRQELEGITNQTEETQRRLNAELDELRYQTETLGAALEGRGNGMFPRQDRPVAVPPQHEEDPATGRPYEDDVDRPEDREAPQRMGFGASADAVDETPRTGASFFDDRRRGPRHGDEGDPETGPAEDDDALDFGDALPVPASYQGYETEDDYEYADEEEEEPTASSVRSFLFTGALLVLVAALSLWTWQILSDDTADQSEPAAETDPVALDTDPDDIASVIADAQPTTPPENDTPAEPFDDSDAFAADGDNAGNAGPSEADADLAALAAANPPAAAFSGMGGTATSDIRRGWDILLGSEQGQRMGNRLKTLVCQAREGCSYDEAEQALLANEEASARLMQLSTRYLAEEVVPCDNAIRVDGVLGSRSVGAFRQIIDCVENGNGTSARDDVERCDPLENGPCPPPTVILDADNRSAWEEEFWRWALAEIARA